MRNLPCAGSARTVKVRVVAIPAPAGTELYDGQVPRNHHRDNLFLSGLERKPHCDRTREVFITAGPTQIAVRQCPIFREWRPHHAAIAVRLKCGLVTHLYSGRILRCDHELSVPLVTHSLGAIAIEDDSFHSAFGLNMVIVSRVQMTIPIMRERAQPSHHVRPREKNRDGYGFIGGVLRMPAIDRDGVTALTIILRKHRRKLLEYNTSGKFVGAVVEP